MQKGNSIAVEEGWQNLSKYMTVSRIKFPPHFFSSVMSMLSENLLTVDELIS